MIDAGHPEVLAVQSPSPPRAVVCRMVEIAPAQVVAQAMALHNLQGLGLWWERSSAGRTVAAGASRSGEQKRSVC